MKLSGSLIALVLVNSSAAFQGNGFLNRVSIQPALPSFVSTPKTTETTTAFSFRLFTSADDEASEEAKKEHLELPDESASDILNSPAFLKRKLELLNEDVVKVEKNIEEMKVKVEEGKAEWGEKMSQLDKEYINIQERLIKQTSESGGRALIDVARKLLDVIDNYDRAFKSVTPSNDEETAIEADYKKSYDSIVSTFKQLGITEVGTTGKEFDYEVHQAVYTRPSEYEEGTVCEELATGWLLGDQLIRPAMVCVSQ